MNKLIYALSLFLLAGCTSHDDIGDDGVIVPPVVTNPSTEKVIKPKCMWLTAYDVNFNNLRNPESVKKYLNYCKLAGINLIYADCTAQTGYTYGDVPSFKRSPIPDWDWFDCIANTCDELDLDLVVGLSPLLVGDPKTRTGVAYDSNRWDGKTQCKKVKEGNTYKVVDSRDDITTVATVLDPTIPEVREYAAQMSVAVAQAYKDHKSFKGISLDYVRWANGDDDGNWYGYGDATVRNFESETGIKINSLDEFINAGGGFGTYFTEWVYFRTEAVTRTIKLIYERVKAAIPDCEIHLWASAQWGSRYSVGQNWATQSYVPQGAQYIAGYEKTGFAEYLDVFILGAYANDVYIKDNPGSDWTVENFVTSYTRYIPKNHPCKVYGSLAAYAYTNADKKEQQMRDATFLALRHTDGLMVFELGHVSNLNHWSAIKAGIDLYEK